MNQPKARRINRWSTVHDTFDAPEQPVRICGVREGEDFPVTTSRIKKVTGRLVETSSGSLYELGDIDSEFLAFLVKNGYEFDPENPIRSVSERTELPAHSVRPTAPPKGPPN